MVQATQATITSRRPVLTGALAALPAVALASVPATADPDAALIALEQKLIDASALEPAFFSAFGKAEETMFKWDKHNPKPKMRKCQIGPTREFGEYIRQLIEFDGERSKITVADPNVDLQAATLEHTQACAEWRARRHRAEERCGYPDAD